MWNTLTPFSDIPSRWALWSATNGDFDVPRSRLKIGERAFSIAAARAWKQLPIDFRSSSRLRHSKTSSIVAVRTTNISDFDGQHSHSDCVYVVHPRSTCMEGASHKYVLKCCYWLLSWYDEVRREFEDGPCDLVMPTRVKVSYTGQVEAWWKKYDSSSIFNCCLWRARLTVLLPWLHGIHSVVEPDETVWDIIIISSLVRGVHLSDWGVNVADLINTDVSGWSWSRHLTQSRSFWDGLPSQSFDWY